MPIHFHSLTPGDRDRARNEKNVTFAYILGRAPEWAEVVALGNSIDEEFERRILLAMSEKYISIDVSEKDLGLGGEGITYRITYIKLKEE